MQRAIRFFLYNNIVPIAVSFALLGAATTYAATNPDKIINKEDRVVSIDNTYIAHINLSNYSPSVQILSVTEDDDAYYVQYVFSTIALIDAVWKDTSSTETLTVSKQSLGGYRDLGLFVTKQLKEKIQAEIKRLQETQVIEKKQITQKKVVTKYKGLVGGFLDDKQVTLAGYTPVVRPPKPDKEAQTFARPDPNAKKPAELVTETPVEIPEEPLPEDQDIPPTDTDPQDGANGTTTSTTTPDTSGDSNATTTSSTTDAVPNDPPTLAILGDNPVRILVGDAYTDLGAVATDDHDTELSIQVYVDSVLSDSVALDTSMPAEHTIIYESVDSAGAIAQVSRTVSVRAKEAEATSTPPVATSTQDSHTSSSSEDAPTEPPAEPEEQPSLDTATTS